MSKRTDITLDVLTRKNTTYLPSQLVFSTQAKEKEFADAMGFKTEEECNKYLNNHFIYTAAYDDVTAFFNGNRERNMRVVNDGINTFDPATNRVRDRWGCEFDIDAPYGFFNYGHQLEGADEDEINAYKAPEMPDDKMDLLFSMAMEDKAKYEEDLVVICGGYCGVYERAYNMLTLEDFMYYMTAEPKMLYNLMEKIADQKVRTAQEVVKRGFRMGHTGDDLGTQINTFFSPEMFRSLVLPHLKRIFKVYNDAGIPVQLHSCGYITPFIPDLIDAGLNILEPTQPVMDIEFLKREYGKDLIFYGGVDTQKLLAFGTPQEVKDETKRTIEILGKDGGLVIAPAQEIMPNVPIQNVVAFAEAVKEMQGDQAKQYEE